MIVHGGTSIYSKDNFQSIPIQISQNFCRFETTIQLNLLKKNINVALSLLSFFLHYLLSPRLLPVFSPQVCHKPSLASLQELSVRCILDINCSEKFQKNSERRSENFKIVKKKKKKKKKTEKKDTFSKSLIFNQENFWLSYFQFF